MLRHLNLIFPQWQGGGPDKSTYAGALDLKAAYLQTAEVLTVEVSTENISGVQKNIMGYAEIAWQLKLAQALIDQAQPETIFTVGGGCDADIAPIAYLNAKTKGDMAILWIDAHGDLNTPESSGSKCFHGMPLRTLLGDGEAMTVKMAAPHLVPSQLMLLGTRDLDEAEKEYIDQQNIKLFTVQEIGNNLDAVMEALRLKGYGKIYVHIDVDVLDPRQFPHVPLPVEHGLSIPALQALLQRLNQEFCIAGLGIFEYQPAEGPRPELLKDIAALGINLGQRKES